MSNPFRYFNSSPEVIRLVVMFYVRYPLSLRNVEDLLVERGIDMADRGASSRTGFALIPPP
jgi:putative transposase